MFKTRGKYLLMLFIGCFLFSTNLQAQISGYVYNKSTGEPLSQANVLIADQNIGTATNVKGFFSLDKVKFPATVRVTFIGFDTALVVVDKEAQNINIKLNPEKTLLEAVTVSAKPKKAQSDPKAWIFDYEIFKDNIMLLVGKNKVSKPELVIISDRLDTIARRQLHFKCKSLYRDCTGNIHLITDDHAYQIFFNGLFIELLYKTDLPVFYNIMKDCMTSNDEEIIVVRKYLRGMIEDVISVDVESKKEELIFTLTDEERIEMLIDEIEMDHRPTSSGDPWAFIRLKTDHMDYSELRYMILPAQDRFKVHTSKRIGSQVFFRDGGLLLFDFNHQNILFHKNGVTDTTQFNFSSKKDWEESLIIDTEGKEFYTLFGKNGYYSLHKIDIKTGTTKKVVDLEYPFVEKVRVHDSKVWFLYTPANRDQRKNLYYIPLPE